MEYENIRKIRSGLWNVKSGLWKPSGLMVIDTNAIIAG